MANLMYANPQTGKWEVREFGTPVKGQMWDRNAKGGIALVEHATDALLGLERIADPVTTALVQGYSLPNVIGDQLCTPVKMEKESGKFPSFGKEALFIPADLKRGVGQRVSRANVQNGSIQMSLSEYAQGVGIENRERNEFAGTFDMLLTSKLNVVTGRVARLREQLQATLLTTTTNYATGNYIDGSGKKWASTGDPITDCRQLILQVQKKAGQRPNKFWFTPTAWELFIANVIVKQTLKGMVNFGSLNGAMVSPAMAAAALQVEEVLIGYATYATDTSTTITDGAPLKTNPTDGFIWEGVYSSAVGTLVVGTGGGIEPAFCYTFERKNSPIVESYYENRTKSQIWDYEHFFDPVVTLNTAGAMYYNVA